MMAHVNSNVTVTTIRAEDALELLKTTQGSLNNFELIIVWG